MIADIDKHHMKSALLLAQRGIGRVWPNPSVGCVIVNNATIVGRAHTADGGRPHAETIAIGQAGQQCKGAALYVTLEPCAHHGKTPPCVDAIIAAGVSRVVIGIIDPDSRTSYASVEKLKDAGIVVVVGILEDECRSINAGFFNKINNNRPYITLKTACSIDGKVATKSGESQWLTGEIARKHVHLMRSRHDATLVGIGTVLEDDPMLTTRLFGINHNPVRIVLDSSLKIPLDSKLVESAKQVPLWVFHVDNDKQKEGSLEKAGVRLFEIKGKSISAIMNMLAHEGITRVLVEGGATIHTSFIDENMYDELMVYRAPIIIGADAMPAMLDFNVENLKHTPKLRLKETRTLGKDLLEIYKPRE